MHATRSCTHCSSSRIRFGPHSMCFLLAAFRLAKALWGRARICATLFTFFSGVHHQLLFILEDGEPARLHFAALVHGAFDPHVPGHVGVWISRDGLSEVSAKEGDLISRPRAVSISQKLDNHLPYLLMAPSWICGWKLCCNVKVLLDS